MTHAQRANGAMDQFGTLPSEIGALIETVRRIVKDTVPEVEERIYKGGLSIGYHVPKFGSLCGLFPWQDGVAIVFLKGITVPDPEGLLHKPGQPGQSIYLPAGQDIPEEALAQLLLAMLIFGAK